MNKSERPTALGKPCPFTRFVFFDPPSQVRCDARVESPVGAFQDIDCPTHVFMSLFFLMDIWHLYGI